MTLLIVHIAVLTLGLYNSVQTDPTDYYTHRAAFEYMCLYQLQQYPKSNRLILPISIEHVQG